jgi:hypothetical protein
MGACSGTNLIATLTIAGSGAVSDDLRPYGWVVEVLYNALRDRFKAASATIVLATAALIGAWSLLSGVGAVADSAAGIDLGLGLVILGLILAPLVILGIGRRTGLHGLGAWLIVGPVSFVLAVVIFFVLMLLFLTLVLGYR